MALGAVDEDRDGEQVIADWSFPAGEDRATRNGELLVARLALPRSARGDRVHDQTATARAIRLPAVIRPADFAEFRMRFLIRQPRDLSEAQAPCGCCEEEVLRHGVAPLRALLMHVI